MASHADWLPLAREDGKYFMRDSRVMAFIELHGSTDWFLRFALAITQDGGDIAQAKMVTKAYAFLRDFMPSGFTGQWSHIMGQDVMNVLMSHTKDMAVTRHKATKDIQETFTQLEDWMKTGATFKEAIGKEHAGKGKERRALTLYSPAHLVALLIISYPDATFRQWIGRLQIPWMMYPLAEMVKHTTDGFWKDLTAADFSMFQPEPQYISETPLLADYNRLFGPDFLKAAKDFRPFLPSWVKAPFDLGRPLPAIDQVLDMGGQADRTIHVGSSGSVGDIGSGGQAAGVAEAPDSARELSDSEVSDLCRHLNPEPGLERAKLAEWLGERLGRPSAVFRFWCQSWADRIGSASHFQDQVLLQSLFVQSLYRVHSLSNVAAEDTMLEPLMLLDVEDGKPRELTEAEKKSIRRLEKSPIYKPFLNAKTELIKAARDKTICDLLPGIYDEQMGFFCDLIKSSTFNNQLKKTVKLDTLRTKAITQGALAKSARQPSLLPADKASPGVVFNSMMIKRLRLTKWQLRILAVSGPESANLLTDWQSYILHPEHSTLKVYDLSQYEPVNAQSVYCKDKNHSQETREMLHKFFGDLETAFTKRHGIRLRNKSPGTLPRSITPDGPSRIARNPMLSASSASDMPVDDDKQPRDPAKDYPNRGAPPESMSLGSPESLDAFSLDDNNTPGSMSAKSTPGSAFSRNPTRTDMGEEPRAHPRATLAPATPSRVRHGHRRSPFPGSSACPNTDGDWNPFEGRVASMKRSRSPDLNSALLGKFPRLEPRKIDPVEELKSHLKADVSDWLRDEVKSMVGEIMDSMDGCALVSTRHVKYMEEKVNAITQALEALKKTNTAESAERAPLPGQEGYLRSCCPAPPGWDSKAYEQTLVRAALFYVAQLGEGVDEGFEADEEAFTLMVEKFPDVVRSHLLASLQHLHTQAYGRPLQWE